MKLFLLLPLLLAACAHEPSSAPAAEDAQIAQLDRASAQERLTATGRELNDVDEKIRTAQTQLDTYEFQAQKSTAKDDAVEGARAEVSALQAKRGALLHRQHVLEARLRELGWRN